MAAEPEVIAWKYANRLVPDAEPSALPKVLGFWFNPLMRSMKRTMGGLWVGGSVTLTRDAVTFEPNALNTAAHAGDTTLRMHLANVTEVADRYGWFTRIVDVRASDGTTLTFRCYGAPAFAEKIRRAVEGSRNR